MIDIKIEIDDEAKTAIIDGYVSGDKIIAMGNNCGNRWSIAMSTCLPSDIEKARLYVECLSKAFEEMEKISL